MNTFTNQSWIKQKEFKFQLRDIPIFNMSQVELSPVKFIYVKSEKKKELTFYVKN